MYRETQIDFENPDGGTHARASRWCSKRFSSWKGVQRRAALFASASLSREGSLHKASKRIESGTFSITLAAFGSPTCSRSRSQSSPVRCLADNAVALRPRAALCLRLVLQHRTIAKLAHTTLCVEDARGGPSGEATLAATGPSLRDVLLQKMPWRRDRFGGGGGARGAGMSVPSTTKQPPRLRTVLPSPETMHG